MSRREFAMWIHALQYALNCSMYGRVQAGHFTEYESFCNDWFMSLWEEIPNFKGYGRYENT